MVFCKDFGVLGKKRNVFKFYVAVNFVFIEGLKWFLIVEEACFKFGWNVLIHRRPKNVAINFVHCKRRRQRIVYIYSIHKVGNLISADEHMTVVKHKIHRSWN